jgi:hypothetical protein
MTLRSITDALESGRFSYTFLLLLAFSLGIGVLAGSRTMLSPKLLLTALAILNALLLAYLLLLRSMVFGVIAYLLSIAFLQYQWVWILPGALPDLAIHRLIFVFIWMVFLLEIGTGGRRMLPNTRIELAMMAMVLSVVLSLILFGGGAIRLMLNGFALPYAMFIVAKNIFKTEEDLRRLFVWMILPLSIYFPVNHIFEIYGLEQLVFPRYILDPNVGGESGVFGVRAIGAFLQPVATGFAMISCFYLSLYYLSRKSGALSRIVTVFLVLITPPAIYFIYTRSVYLGFFLSLIVLMVMSKRLKILAIIMIMMIGVGFVVNLENALTSDRTQGGLAVKSTAIQRLVLLEASLNMFKDRPFLGVGFNRFSQFSVEYVRQIRTTALGYRESFMGKHIAQHNHWLNTLTELGLSGFVPLLLVYIFMLSMFRKALSQHDHVIDRDFVVVVIAIWVEFMTNMMFMEPRFFEFMNVFLFITAGVVTGSYQRSLLAGGISRSPALAADARPALPGTNAGD